MELQRVVSNLVENSIEAIKEDKATDVGEVSIYIEVDALNLKVRIEDNGQEIPENLLDKVRQKGGSYGKDGGEGLGLYSSIRRLKAGRGV